MWRWELCHQKRTVRSVLLTFIAVACICMLRFEDVKLPYEITSEYVSMECVISIKIILRFIEDTCCAHVHDYWCNSDYSQCCDQILHV